MAKKLTDKDLEQVSGGAGIPKFGSAAKPLEDAAMQKEQYQLIMQRRRTDEEDRLNPGPMAVKDQPPL